MISTIRFSGPPTVGSIHYHVSLLQNQKVIGDQPSQQDPLPPANLSLKARRRPSPRSDPGGSRYWTRIHESFSRFTGEAFSTATRSGSQHHRKPPRTQACTSDPGKRAWGPAPMEADLAPASFTCGKPAGGSHTRPRSPNDFQRPPRSLTTCQPVPGAHSLGRCGVKCDVASQGARSTSHPCSGFDSLLLFTFPASQLFVCCRLSYYLKKRSTFPHDQKQNTTREPPSDNYRLKTRVQGSRS